MSEPSAAAASTPSSFSEILRSSTIIGAASIFSIGAGIARQKAAALILGPAGVGLIGLLQNIVSLGIGIGSMGVGTSATREIATAAAADDARRLASVRKALFWLTAVQVALAVVIFWFLRDWLAVAVVRDAGEAPAIGWLSVGVGFGIIAAAQAGLLLGLRRIGDTARITMAGALASALAGVVLLYLLEEEAIALFVILPSTCMAIAGCYYLSRLPKPRSYSFRARELLRKWRPMAGLGIALTAGGSAVLLGQLVLRVIIQDQLGVAALGLFQAAATLSLTYVGFVLQSMAADYSPRLTMVINDHGAASRLVNEQTEVALLLAAPFILLGLGAAPLLFQLFYSSAFAEATAIFRWQVLGDVLKIASWPLGFILVARGEGRMYILTESGATLVLLLLTWIGIPYLGIAATGVAYFGMYALYLPIIYSLAVNRIGFRWNGSVARTLFILVAASGSVAALSTVSESAALSWSAILAIGAALFGYRRLGSSLPHALPRIFRPK